MTGSSAHEALAQVQKKLKTATDSGSAGASAAQDPVALGEDIDLFEQIPIADRFSSADRIASLVQRYMREAVTRCVSSYNREWDRVITVFADETRFAFTSENPDDEGNVIYMHYVRSHELLEPTEDTDHR